jgi:YgiT-type zinc finger domain-containing protein
MNPRLYPCEFCDTERQAQAKQVTITRQRHGQWFIFEDVPALVCPNCGHRYFSAEVLQAMEAQMRDKPADARPVQAWAMSLAHKTG